MNNIIGILIVVLGFFSPFLSKGRVPPALFFWTGFLFLLRPIRYLPIKATWANWGRIGLLINVAASLFVILCTHIVESTDLSHSYLAGKLLTAFYWIAAPIEQLFALLIPYPRFDLANGSVGFQISFTRGVLTDFFDIFSYVFLAVVIGNSFYSRLKIGVSE
jgi:hypothetical protein